MSGSPEERIAELEMRVSFQEHALGELSDALAQSRMEVYRQSEQLRRAMDELKAMRSQVPGDSGNEPPPPHY
ncbi:SlyX family protein [Arenimonas sp.]|jgi:SlyX protein|uniref:SlyX family protein n=1 Tax=Arenimonas sp. TaxID=1872635 RepID=UPI0037C15C46